MEDRNLKWTPVNNVYPIAVIGITSIIFLYNTSTDFSSCFNKKVHALYTVLALYFSDTTP